MATRMLNWLTLKVKGQTNALKLTIDNREHVFKLSELPKGIDKEVLAYGLKQKLADSVSSEKDHIGKENGILETWQQLVDGDWTGSGRGTKLVIEAFARVGNVSVEVARQVYDGMDEKAQKALAGKTSIQQAVLKIKEERLAAKAAKDDSDDIAAMFKTE